MVERQLKGGAFSAREIRKFDLTDPHDVQAAKTASTEAFGPGKALEDRVAGMEELARQKLRDAGLPGTVTAYRVDGGPWIEIEQPPKPFPRQPGEQICRIAKIVEIAGHEHDSDLGYAARIVALAHQLRQPHSHWRLAQVAFDLGCLIREAQLKWQWEDDAYAGYKQRRARQEGGAMANATRHAESAAIWEEWQAEADAIWTRSPYLSVADCALRVKRNLKLKVSKDTIRKRLVKKVGKAR